MDYTLYDKIENQIPIKKREIKSEQKFKFDEKYKIS